MELRQHVCGYNWFITQCYTNLTKCKDHNSIKTTPYVCIMKHILMKKYWYPKHWNCTNFQLESVKIGRKEGNTAPRDVLLLQFCNIFKIFRASLLKYWKPHEHISKRNKYLPHKEKYNIFRMTTICLVHLESLHFPIKSMLKAHYISTSLMAPSI